MPNYDIKVSVPRNPAQKKPINYCTWKCPFCQGTGLNPYGKVGTDRCPACHGNMNWEADTVCNNLTTCGRCAGSGRINYMGNWSPCTNCRGSGKV
jgi:DnaJ-class molecular chaperone